MLECVPALLKDKLPYNTVTIMMLKYDVLLFSINLDFFYLSSQGLLLIYVFFFYRNCYNYVTTFCHFYMTILFV